MIEGDPKEKPKQPEVKKTTARINLPDIDEIIDRRADDEATQAGYFPNNDYEDLSTYLDPYQNG